MKFSIEEIGQALSYAPVDLNSLAEKLTKAREKIVTPRNTLCPAGHEKDMVVKSAGRFYYVCSICRAAANSRKTERRRAERNMNTKSKNVVSL